MENLTFGDRIEIFLTLYQKIMYFTVSYPLIISLISMVPPIYGLCHINQIMGFLKGFIWLCLIQNYHLFYIKPYLLICGTLTELTRDKFYLIGPDI